MQTRSSPSLSTLHSLARTVGLTDYDKLPKRVLYERLQQQFDFERLNRAQVRHTKRGREDDVSAAQNEASVKSAKGKGKKKQKRSTADEPINTVDPIMFTDLGKHRFIFVRPNGAKVQFNVDTLVDYLLATGDFSEPETRLPFSDQDLKRLDQLASAAGLKKPSVYTAKKDPQMFAEMKFRRDALLGLERCCGEVVTEMMRLVDDPNPEEVEMHLVMREFPLFADFFRQLDEADHDYAKQCLLHFNLYLKGPPNRPTQDPYGTLDLILQFMHRLSAGNEFGF